MIRDVPVDSAVTASSGDVGETVRDFAVPRPVGDATAAAGKGKGGAPAAAGKGRQVWNAFAQREDAVSLGVYLGNGGGSRSNRKLNAHITRDALHSNPC